MWAEDADPFGHLAGDDIRTQPSDKDAEQCRMYAKRRMPNHEAHTPASGSVPPVVGGTN